MTVTEMSDTADFELPDEITSGEDLFQTAVREYGGDREFEYKLSAFVPKCVSPPSGTVYPSEAAYWIIPDINNCVIVSVVKLFELSFLKTVPKPYNTLYLRVDRHNKPNPTEFQEAVWKAAVSNYPRKDGLATVSQLYLTPVISRYKGEWNAQVGELGITAHGEVKKANATADDMSDGRINLGTRPVAIWREGQKDFYARFDKGADVDVQEMIREYKDQLPNVREYIKTRAVATEKYLLDQWRKFQDGAVAEFNTDMNPKERYIEAVMSLGTPQLSALLKEGGITVKKGATKMAMLDIALANQDTLEAAVLASATDDPPF